MFNRIVKLKLPVAIIFVVAFIIIAYISFRIGANNKLNSMVLQKAQSEIQIINNQSSELSKEIDNLTNDCNNLDKEMNEKTDIINAQTKYISDRATYNNNITKYNSSLQTINKSIAEKESELALLSNGILKNGEPIVLGAGEHTVGLDIPVGRYIVTGSRNFVVRSSSGKLLVNTILGGGSHGVDSYTCNLSGGDSIKVSGKATFQPVK